MNTNMGTSGGLKLIVVSDKKAFVPLILFNIVTYEMRNKAAVTVKK
jgi:hypothetical protein